MRILALGILLVGIAGCGTNKVSSGALGGAGGGNPGVGGGGGGRASGGAGGKGGAAVGGGPGRASGGAGGAGIAGSGGAGGAAGWQGTGGAAGVGGTAGASSVGGSAGGTGGAGGNAGAGGAAGSPAPGCAVPEGASSLPVCSAPHPCDPAKVESAFCRNIPPTNAATLSYTVWIEDAAAPDGGWRVTLTGINAVSAGGHSYQDMQEGLVGTGGNGIYGDLYLARDGQARWTGFHMEGWPLFHGAGVWDWPATLTISRTGAAAATVGRHYTITRTGASCSGAGPVTYLFAADDPPRACAFGIDLVAITLPGS